jgi:hypothetical protein
MALFMENYCVPDPESESTPRTAWHRAPMVPDPAGSPPRARAPHQGPGGGRSPTPLKPEVSPGTPEVDKLRLSEWTGRDGKRRSKLQV